MSQLKPWTGIELNIPIGVFFFGKTAAEVTDKDIYEAVVLRIVNKQWGAYDKKITEGWNEE